MVLNSWVLLNLGSSLWLFFFQVSLQFSTNQTEPGDSLSLTVNAYPNSYVGILAVDQSVLLMRGGNDITQDMVSCWYLLLSTCSTYSIRDETLHYPFVFPQYSIFGLFQVLISKPTTVTEAFRHSKLFFRLLHRVPNLIIKKLQFPLRVI